MKILLYLLLCSSIAYGQSSDADLTTQANQIKNETTPGANTATRVGDMFLEIIDSKVNIDRTINGYPLSGNVTLSKTDFSLGNVDNTSDANKPVSTATQTAMETTTKVLITGAATLDATAFGKMHVCSGVAADYTIALPTAVGNEGKMIAFKGDPELSILNKIITIDPNGVQKVDSYDNMKIGSGGTVILMARVTSGVGSWDVITYSQGSSIPILIAQLVGFSSTTTYDISYMKSGRKVSVSGIVVGTGSATNNPILTLPFTARANITIPVTVTNNVTPATGMMVLAAGATTATFYIAPSGTSFTQSVGRAIYFQFEYEAQ